MALFVASGLTQTGNNLVGVNVLASASILGPQTSTSFGLGIADGWSIVCQGTGFGGYSGNHPTTGTITSWIAYDEGADGGELAAIFSGFSISVTDFNTWVTAGNDTALQNAIFGGNDTIIGSFQGEEDFWGYGGNDVLRGEGGGDELHGGIGSDTASYTTSATSVQVNLLAGTGGGGDAQGDTYDSIENVWGSFLNDTLIGNNAANSLKGVDGADTLSGGGGADVLNGGRGHDAMTGGGGADKFVFNAPAIAANSDTIADFVHLSDKIQFENSVFDALGVATGALAAAKFFAGANAHDADDRIIYNAGTGELFYDANGNAAGQKVLIATLDAGLTITASDFQLI